MVWKPCKEQTWWIWLAMPEQIPQVELCSLIFQDLLSAMDLARLKQTEKDFS